MSRPDPASFAATPSGLSWQRAGAVLAMIGVATALGLGIAARWGSSSVVLLYVPPVLAAAGLAGRWLALLAAVVGTLAFNFFFTEPYFTLLIRNPGDGVTVAMLLLVGLVISHLVTSLRAQAELASFHASRNATIAGFAGRLLSCSNEAAIAEVAVAELARIFECHACILSPVPEPHVIAATMGKDGFAPGDLAAAAQALSSGARAGRGVARDRKWGSFGRRRSCAR